MRNFSSPTQVFLLNLNSIDFTIFFSIFELFFFTNADVVTINHEASKKIRETNAGQIKEQDVPLISICFMIVFRSLIFELFFFRNADVLTIKDEASKENS
jgi:hypothetical protein